VKIKQSFASRFFDVGNIAFMLILVIVTIYPMYYVFIVSISDGNYVMRGLVKLIPRGLTVQTYRFIFDNPDFLRSYMNTIIYTTVGTAINLAFTIGCAYPLSRATFYGRNLFTALIAFTMFFSGGLIPSYIVIQNLGLVNSMWALILPAAINTWYMIIMRTFFQGIPNVLSESAYIDGANELTILSRIVIPLSKPILATMTMFYAVYHWNSFFPATIFINEKAKYPVQVILRNIVISGELDAQNNTIGAVTDFAVIATNYKYAVIIITVVPILIVYPFIQKYFTKGVMIGAIKG